MSIYEGGTEGEDYLPSGPAEQDDLRFLGVEGRYMLPIDGQTHEYEVRALGFGYWLATPTTLIPLVGTSREVTGERLSHGMPEIAEMPTPEPFVYYHPYGHPWGVPQIRST